MTTATRQKLVDYTVYIAKDGKEFDSEHKCEDYELRQKGERITCPCCYGRGSFSLGVHNVLNELTYKYEPVEQRETCPKCGGKGYLDKTVTWK